MDILASVAAADGVDAVTGATGELALCAAASDASELVPKRTASRATIERRIIAQRSWDAEAGPLSSP